MHGIFFGAKRVHLEVVHRLTRPLLVRAECELTPARFDMMRIVHVRKEGILQRAIQWLLGVSAPTVSRMLKSLEALGMVTRTGADEDARCRLVLITPRGKACVEKALAATVGAREDQLAVARCATGSTKHRTSFSNDARLAFIEATKRQVDDLDAALARMRKALFDIAPLRHPWRADVSPDTNAEYKGEGRYWDEVPRPRNWLAPSIWTRACTERNFVLESARPRGKRRSSPSP